MNWCFVPGRKGHIDFEIRTPKIQMIDYKAQIEWSFRVIDIVLKMFITSRTE